VAHLRLAAARDRNKGLLRWPRRGHSILIGWQPATTHAATLPRSACDCSHEYSQYCCCCAAAAGSRQLLISIY
jgi:hypothetical protein